MENIKEYKRVPYSYWAGFTLTSYMKQELNKLGLVVEYYDSTAGLDIYYPY